MLWRGNPNDSLLVMLKRVRKHRGVWGSGTITLQDSLGDLIPRNH